MKRVIYQIFGKVVSEGRGRAVRCGGFTRVVTPVATRIGRQEHIKAFCDASPGFTTWAGPVSVDIVVYRRRPKSWWPGKHCRGKPDLDNVAKLVLDALSGYAYPDDNYVEAILVRREWADADSVAVKLEFEPESEKPRRKPKCTFQA